MAAHVWPWREIISIQLARYKIHTELTLHISERIDRKRQLQPHGQRLRRHLPSAKQSLSGHTDTHTKRLNTTDYTIAHFFSSAADCPSHPQWPVPQERQRHSSWETSTRLLQRLGKNIWRNTAKRAADADGESSFGDGVGWGDWCCC